MTTRADHLDDENVSDYRHDETRKNNPPAALASQGKVRELRPQRYAYDPHMQPSLRFDDTGAADRLRGLLAAAKERRLSAEEAEEMERYLGNPQPWLEWTGKREKQWFEVEPVALHIHERVSAQAAIRVAARQDVPRTLWADPEQEYREAITMMTPNCRQDRCSRTIRGGWYSKHNNSASSLIRESAGIGTIPNRSTMILDFRSPSRNPSHLNAH